MGSAETRPLGITGAKLLAVSASGELAFLRESNRALRFFGPGSGTLARVSLAGGAPRDVLDQVAAADWIPGTNQLVVARTDGQVEFPIGTKFYKPGAGGIRALRVAPDGARLALILRDPARAAMSVLVLDHSGRTIASSAWTDAGSLAWSPDGREVWFSATRQFVSHVLCAMSMAGQTRVLVATEPEMHIIQDVRDGRILLASHQPIDDRSQPRPISPEGVGTNALATPDGRFVWGVSSSSGHALYPVDEGRPRPMPFLSAGDAPLQWSPDGRYLYVRRDSWPPQIERVDTASGTRVPCRTVFPADPVGVDGIEHILITPDEATHCHTTCAC